MEQFLNAQFTLTYPLSSFYSPKEEEQGNRVIFKNSLCVYWRLAMTGVNKKGDSLCERSMKMVVSIIKLTSFSIAKMSLRGGAPKLQVPVRIIAPTETPGRANPRNLYSQEPRGSSKNISNLIEPDEGIGSSFMFRDWENIDSMASEFIDRVHRGNVDGMASNYIDRVHKKNQHSFRESSGDSPIILPPRLVR